MLPESGLVGGGGDVTVLSADVCGVVCATVVNDNEFVDERLDIFEDPSEVAVGLIAYKKCPYQHGGSYVTVACAIVSPVALLMMKRVSAGTGSHVGAAASPHALSSNEPKSNQSGVDAGRCDGDAGWLRGGICTEESD